MAPELSIGAAGHSQSTRASDIFALSMTLLNIWSRNPPFYKVRDVQKVTTMLRDGERPARPGRSDFSLRWKQITGHFLWACGHKRPDEDVE